MKLFIFLLGFLPFSYSFIKNLPRSYIYKRPLLIGYANELPITIKPENKTQNEINDIQPIILENHKNNITNVIDSKHSEFHIPGITLGIPLNIFAYFSTYPIYGENILTPKISLLLFLIGAYTYGNDKLQDALYNKNPTKKQEYILENYDILKNIYNSFYVLFSFLLFENNGISIQTYEFLLLYELSKLLYSIKYTFFSYYLGIQSEKILILYLLLSFFILKTHIFDHELLFLPFLILLDSTNSYMKIKQSIGPFKSVYLSFMWLATYCFMPVVIHDEGYQNLNLENFNSIISPFLMMIGFSNWMDNKDIQDDRSQKINTIPVLFGKNNSTIFSLFCIFYSIWLYSQ